MKTEKDYIKTIDNAERRFIETPVDIRDDGEANIIHGIAARVGVPYDMGWYEEEVLEGAFDDALNDDVRALFNHSPNYPLARSNNGKGTLKLFIDDDGNLAYEYKTPNRSYAKDLEDAILSGDITQSSWAFRIKEQTWIEREGQPELRQIVKVENIFDVSPVTYPANSDTTVAKRSFEDQKPKFKPNLKRKLRIKELETKM